ncbi:MAG: hypothetical protein R3F35_01660 [Myxococcota bacterium]
MALQNPLTFISPRISRRLGEITVDAVIEETTRRAAAITDHPVEIPSGSVAPRGSISDHVFLLPRHYVMRGVITDQPIGLQNAVDSLDAVSGSGRRSQVAYQLLNEHFERREPFTVETAFETLENMVFETLTFPRDSGQANSIIFSAELREVQVVRSAPIVRGKGGGVPAEQLKGDQAKTQAVSEKRRGEMPGREVSVGSKAYNAAKDMIKRFTGIGGAP